MPRRAVKAEIRAIHNRVAELSGHLDSGINTSQADREGTRLELSSLENLVTQVRQTLEFHHAVQSSAQIQIRTALSDLQLRQAWSMIGS